MTTPKRSRFNVLARLWPRTKNAVIGELYTHVLNAPLLVEPRRGEALLNAYLQGDTEEIYLGPRGSSVVSVGPSGGVQSPGKIAIINISGALASRPTPGPSGDGPQNYEQIGADFDAAMADASVGAIVFRLDSPGGFVAGCFDLTDHIFESRGVKPIVAVVDDMAYSACYAIAAACDEIWVTRTAGVGSVGVVSYHIDQSAYDKNLGVKVTAIYAGAHKNDFTPHEPLSDAAREREQAEVDRLYALFVESVARYRGMRADDVRKTEALTYSGPDALSIGFADKLGTLDDALMALSEQPETEEQRQARAAAEAAAEQERIAAEAEREKQRVKGVLAAAVAAATDLPAAVAQKLVALEVPESEVQARVEHALDVVKACKLANLEDIAPRLVEQNMPIDKVGAELLERKAEIDRKIEVDNVLPAAHRGGARVPGVWDNTIVKFGGKLQ